MVKAFLINRFLSQFWYNSTQGCMTFWYHMKGPQQGKLSFGIKPYNQPFNSLWSLSGEQGDDWKQAQVSIGYSGLQINTTFQMLFEATVGGALSKL